MESKTSVTVEVLVEKPVDNVWQCWTLPEHIMNWNFASDDWHCPSASNDVTPGGRFVWRMEAKDGSFGFDFCGTYTTVETNKRIENTLDDARKVSIEFIDMGNQTRVVETFEAENQNPVDMQRFGWQAILNNFKKYAESAR